MALFGIFRSNRKHKRPKGYHLIPILSIEPLFEGAVKVTLDIKSNQDPDFSFLPGQYLNFAITIDGKEYIRSYSICSGPKEHLSIGVKEIEDGFVSRWFNRYAKKGDQILVASPHGNFTRPENTKNILAIAAGSGITPILSILKELDSNEANAQLFYGNREAKSIMFKAEIDALKNTKTLYYLSKETKEGYQTGRIDKATFTEIVKGDLTILKSDAIFICGPEQMIIDIKDVLKFFGVKENKIHIELFTPPVLLESSSTGTQSNYKGTSKVTVILDNDSIDFDLEADGKPVLEKAIEMGMDAPYSCKGGVCCTCRAKIIKGEATMKINYSLTDDEIKNGYILSCQAHPASDELILSYDE